VSRDWQTLLFAVEDMIADQKDFVAWWDEHVRPAGHQPNVADRQQLAVEEAEQVTGVKKWQVSHGNTDTAMAGTVASATRFLTKAVLTGTISTIVEKVDLPKVRGGSNSTIVELTDLDAECLDNCRDIASRNSRNVSTIVQARDQWGRFEFQTVLNLPIDISALYVLAAPLVPESKRVEAIELTSATSSRGGTSMCGVLEAIRKAKIIQADRH
jgi:hypothetical protein